MKSYRQTRIEAINWLRDCEVTEFKVSRSIQWNKLARLIDQNWDGGFLAFVVDQEHDDGRFDHFHWNVVNS